MRPARRARQAVSSHEPTSLLEPGTGTGFFGGARDVPVTFALPPGWETSDGVFILKSDADIAFGVAFYDVANIYADPCQWVLLDPPVGPTVDDLVSALANAPAFDATAAHDITVDGFEGKQIEFTVPDYDEDECRDGRFGLWKEDSPFGVRNGDAPDLWAQAPGQHNRVWILDVDGTRLTILAGYLPNTSAQDRADLDEILGSIRIG